MKMTDRPEIDRPREMQKYGVGRLSELKKLIAKKAGKLATLAPPIRLVFEFAGRIFGHLAVLLQLLSRHLNVTSAANYGHELSGVILSRYVAGFFH